MMPETIDTFGRTAGAALHEQPARASVTVIGLGMMGQALAGALVTAGHRTTVWNRSAGKADALVAGGARAAASAADALAASPVTIICVSDYAAVSSVLSAAERNGLAGRTIVNLTSGTPEQARALATWAAERGATYLDGAIMAIPPEIGKPETLLLYSGSSDAFEANVSLLRLFGGRTTYLGADPGLAALLDMGLLSMMYTLYGGFLHALALVGTAQITGERFTSYATSWLGAMLSWLPELAREIDGRHFETEISSLDINKDGIAHIVNTSEALGIRADVLRPLQQMIDRRVAAGHGRQGLPSLIEEITRPSA